MTRSFAMPRKTDGGRSGRGQDAAKAAIAGTAQPENAVRHQGFSGGGDIGTEGDHFCELCEKPLYSVRSGRGPRGPLEGMPTTANRAASPRAIQETAW